jgi:hypothetical protein
VLARLEVVDSIVLHWREREREREREKERGRDREREREVQDANIHTPILHWKSTAFILNP